MQRSVRLFSLIILLAMLLTSAVSAGATPSGTVNVQILALNDFHGNLEPPTSSSGCVPAVSGCPAPNVPAGGVEYLATHINNLRALNANTVVVSAGDLIGASPLLSALFHDEPTIEAFNQIGLDFNAVGNHEFDEGWRELKRMQEGGCHPVDGCQDGDEFLGASFQFLAANVVRKDNGKTIFPAYKVRSFAGAKVAFIGMTLEGTPLIVTPSGISDLNFLDEAATVNALVPELKAKGIETIVVLIHEGANQNPITSPFNSCVGVSGPIVDIVNSFDDEVDVVISGHTHQPYNCVIDGKIVTSAFSFGRLVTKVDLTIDRGTGEVVTMVAENKIVTRDVPKDSLITSLIAKYNAFAAPIANRIIGSITGPITRTANLAGESALGDVIADGQLAATDDPGFGEAVVAFMNPGGIRADLTFPSSPANEGDGNVTYGEMFTVQPFGNSMVTMTLTGAQIERLLEEQFAGCTFGSNRILQVSAGFSYTWVASGPVCDKVDPSTIMLNGQVVVATNTYRVTVNSFLADGGDSFPVLTQGTARLGGAVDTDAFEAYFATHSPVAPGPQNRITRVP
ncbi:MAG TPA: bifunctional metallophosphatase/5'-nucleotidase [Anaerolineales bacterium]|nr:bifunctional metallophosphatase/5'-nucleotidase [Anaerolineales bacterium]